MTPTFSIGETRHGQPMVEMHDGGRILAKMYMSETGEKIRIVIPELKNYSQTFINIEQHMLEFTRDPKARVK
jgi:hypothetical protein